MTTLATTKMSSKGQVVIPEEIRKKLGLLPGTRLVVVAGEGVVILKEISPPSISQFDEIIAEARRQAREVGLKKSDIQSAIDEVRTGR